MTCFNVPNDLALNAEGTDFLIGDGGAQLIQKIGNGFTIIPGKYHFDRAHGFPLFDLAFGTTWRFPWLIQAIQDYLLGFPDVLAVTQLDVIPKKLVDGSVVGEVTFQVKTTDGVLTSRDVYMPFLRNIR